jgi:hypothetical protein
LVPLMLGDRTECASERTYFERRVTKARRAAVLNRSRLLDRVRRKKHCGADEATIANVLPTDPSYIGVILVLLLVPNTRATDQGLGGRI